MDSEQQVQIAYESELTTLPEESVGLIQKSLETVLVNSGNKEKVISLYFCSTETSKNLNQTYRGVDKPTDILSWSYEGDEDEIWGELAVCLEVCQSQAKASNWSLNKELLRLLVHGVVHLMGYDHEISEEAEREMLEIEKDLLSSINLNGIYD